MNTATSGASRGTAIALWLVLSAYGGYSVWTCVHEARALELEVRREVGRQERALKRLQREFQEGLGERQRALSALEERAEEERGALARVQRDQVGLGERMRQINAQVQGYKRELPSAPETLEHCMDLLERSERGILRNTWDYAWGDVDAEIQRCRAQIGAVTESYQRASGAVSGLFNSVGEAASAFDELQEGHFKLLAQQDKKQSAEAAARDQAQDLANYEERHREREGAAKASLLEAQRRGWFDLLLARGFDMWAWWLHAGSLVVVIPLWWLVFLRLLHLWGLGRSLQLGGGRSR